MAEQTDRPEKDHQRTIDRPHVEEPSSEQMAAWEQLYRNILGPKKRRRGSPAKWEE